MELNHFIPVGKAQLFKSGIGVAGQMQQDLLLRAYSTG